MKFFILIGFLSLTTNLFGQELNDSTNTDRIILIAEVSPEFPGGRDKLYKFLSRKIEYPKEAKKHNIGGAVVVSFIVERDGTIKPENIKIEQSVHPSLDNEVIRVIRLMPKWTPASQRGRKVRAITKIPITFSAS